MMMMMMMTTIMIIIVVVIYPKSNVHCFSVINKNVNFPISTTFFIFQIIMFVSLHQLLSWVQYLCSFIHPPDILPQINVIEKEFIGEKTNVI